MRMLDRGFMIVTLEAMTDDRLILVDAYGASCYAHTSDIISRDREGVRVGQKLLLTHDGMLEMPTASFVAYSEEITAERTCDTVEWCIDE